MQVDKIDDIRLYQRGFEIQAIGNEGVRAAKEENKKLGIPIVFSIDEVIYYQMPDGTITTKSPFQT